MRELVIIGGGPAAVSAAIYAARKKIDAVIVADMLAGQSVVAEKIENWIGVKELSGYDLALMCEDHLKAYHGSVEIMEGEKASEISRLDNGGFSVKTESGKSVESKAVLLCTGAHHRRLNVPGEKKFEGKGVFFCSTCDAPFMKNKNAVVVGSGNSALEGVEDLLKYAEKVFLIVRSDKIKGDALLFETISASPKLEIIYNAETKEILGEEKVSGLKYADKISGEEKTIEINGVFVEIGMEPGSDIVKGLVEIDPIGNVKVDIRTGRTSLGGIWAAGDVTDASYKQLNIAVGDAIRALLNINDWLKGSGK